MSPPQPAVWRTLGYPRARRVAVVGTRHVVVRTAGPTAETLVARTLSPREARRFGVPRQALLQKVLWWVDTDWARGEVVIQAEAGVLGFVDGVRLGGRRYRARARRRDVHFAHGWKDIQSTIVFGRTGCIRFEVTNRAGETDVVAFRVVRDPSG